MTFKVQVGPAQISIHQGQTVLVTDPDGQIAWPSDRGLYFFDTRVVSAWAIYANGQDWDLLNGGPVTYFAARIFLINQPFVTEDGPVPARTVGLVISRSLSGGLHEDLDVTNHGSKRVRFNLEIAMRSDFADIFEVKSGNIVRRGRITTEWHEARQELRTTYRNADFCRAVTVHPHQTDTKAVYANGRLSFDIAVDPGQTWHCCLLYALRDGEQHFRAPTDCTKDSKRSKHSEALTHWQETVAKIRTSNEEFYRLFHQAVEDMAALRLPMEGTDHMVFLPAAGLPWFIAPFGRDSLIVSWQNLLIYPEFACGALDILGRLQARERDDYRDAEPGKILHEIRYGELAHFKLIPHTPYYGTADATPLWLMTLHGVWRCTGDRSLLERHLKTAERCLAWIDEYGDRDGDGFQEYQTRSPVGYENMGWKDSGEAVVYTDGTLVKGPKALCELQAYVYDAWLRMADIYGELGQDDKASHLRQKAAQLFERFNEAFWDEESGFYAYCLDGDKKKVLSIASNPGHCLTCGIVPADRAERVVRRLMQPDMWSGWGIRTLSADHPAFNPFSYQCGSVWPHDNGLIALGFKRYGFAEQAAAIAHDVSRAASHFLLNQLPELYAGMQRDGANFPVQYLGANVPQAWAAGSAFMLVQAMLGLLADAPRKRLFVDPHLPAWLPDLTIVDLRIGSQKFDIRFWREGEETAFEVLDGDADWVIRRPLAAAAEHLRCGTHGV
ncbi:MAG: amylo-alpha-1,6-glucosidase [Acetobacteraceae bacterium]|nr:amylo-alpha-1,6-glucosidase [Acetobacteraceae bacterium]